ncbi:MAG: hypothetical protein WDW38_011483 [Sanguina aurantia]
MDPAPSGTDPKVTAAAARYESEQVVPATQERWSWADMKQRACSANIASLIMISAVIVWVAFFILPMLLEERIHTPRRPPSQQYSDSHADL